MWKIRVEKTEMKTSKTVIVAALAVLIYDGLSAIERYTAAETLADGLEGGIARDAFARVRSAIGGAIVVSVAAIARAMYHVYRDLGLLVEGSSAAALAPVLAGVPSALGVRGGDLVVLRTGRNVDRTTWERAVAPFTSPA